MEVIDSLLPTDNVVIDATNDEFHDAIQHLRKQDIIGLALEEPECDRYGVLEWLSVSTSMSTFLFDIQKLGKKAFHAGLKTVLENPRIVKILHDCRRPSDCLFHQYDTKLNNIYDTQVADFIAKVQKANPMNLSKTVNTLYHCLALYMQIPEETFHPRPIKSDYSSRPVKENVKDFLIKNVIYLRLLKKELDVVIRIPYRRCVDIYMQSILKKSDGEMKLCPPNLGTVPPEMIMEGMQVFQITEQLQESNSFTQKKILCHNEEDSYRYDGEYITDYISRDFDRTEVIKFLMERMFHGRKVNNGTFTPSVRSDQCSVNSMDVSSLCDPGCPVDCLSLQDKLLNKKEDNSSKKVEVRLSTLSKIKKLSKSAKCQSDSKLLPFENLSGSDTSSKDRSENNLTMTKTIDIVRHLEQNSVLENVEEKSKVGDNSSSFEHSVQVDLKEESNQLKEVHGNLTTMSNILERMDEEDPISIITSKDISPFDKYKYVMAKRSKASSQKSGSSDNFSSKHSGTLSSSECFGSFPSSENTSKKETIEESLPEVTQSGSSAADDEICFSHLNEMNNNIIVEDPWEKLRSAFDSLGPQKPNKKSLFIPAGMNC